MQTLIPYGRKSSREDPAVSKARQDRATKAWAKGAKVKLRPIVWEPGVKGSHDWRERGLGEAIAACARGEADGIVVEEQNRLSRENGLATAEMWLELEKAGARLVCIADGIDTANGDHELNFSIRAALAREQWKQYRRRAEASKLDAVGRGIHIGPAPVGYVRDLHEPLRLDKTTYRAVRAAFELRSTGASYGDVVRLLDRKIPGGPSGEGAWAKNTVKRLLSNRVYLGEARGGAGHVKAGAHPAIVDERTFEACQALARRDERPAPPSARSLLAGVALCRSCGYALQRSTVGGEYRVYTCRGRHAGKVCEAPITAMAGALDELVLEAALERLEGLEIEETPVDTRELEARLRTAQAKRKPFEDPGYVQLLGLDGAKRALKVVDAEIAELQDELAEKLTAGDVQVGSLDAADVLRNGTTDERREILGAMLEGVVVGRAARGTPLVRRVEAVWRGETLPIARPSRGRRAKVRAGAPAAENRASGR